MNINPKLRMAVLASTRAKGFTKARKQHVIPLSPRAMEILASLPSRLDGLVFGPIPDPRRAFQRAAKAAGLERVWLHLMRHLFASRLDERGAGTGELKAAGGWSSNRMVERYSHARLARLRQLVDGPGLELVPGGASSGQGRPAKENGGSA